ncbi:hypothetical protein SARC_07655 [Sphaeroforma arctica JP610]|uniref:Uncharacterized protein n=1 Tax=Sphaeroforma arctica JP610 TaxID=667725 RepID=A0A0L0FT47_9EUKA|nr:hypothetical protein SARC_07655 [Sphaeroforma arctica JP610]KNC79972.1 hypothetical protein SARC_07655 [Sphaeroforma arctica JP610]|eukprot:XP_014153874.1 hypothetical protein SARC_07655 [Sphaeroforma arctica JP610]
MLAPASLPVLEMKKLQLNDSKNQQTKSKRTKSQQTSTTSLDADSLTFSEIHKTVLREVASETFTKTYENTDTYDSSTEDTLVSPTGKKSFASDAGLKEGSSSLIKLKRFFVPPLPRKQKNKATSSDNSNASFLSHSDCLRVRRTWKMACLPKSPQDVFPLLQFSEQFYGTVAVLEPRSKALFTNFLVRSGKLTMMLHLIVSEVEAMVMDNKLEHSKRCRERIKRVLYKHKQASIDTDILIKGGKALLQALIARLGSTFKWTCLLCAKSTPCTCQSSVGVHADKDNVRVGIKQYTSAYSADNIRLPLEKDDAASWMLVYATIVYILENNGKYSFNAEQKTRVYDICTEIDLGLARYKLGIRPTPHKTGYNVFPINPFPINRMGAWLSRSASISPTKGLGEDSVPEFSDSDFLGPDSERERTPSNPELQGMQRNRKGPMPLYRSMDG